jgi:hypothetical protein
MVLSDQGFDHLLRQPRRIGTSFENNQLLAKAEVLGNQSCPGLENGGESIRKAPNHRRVP